MKGITPARAGNTLGWYKCNFVTRDQPRPCGEYEGFAAVDEDIPGSPPPVRGIRLSGLSVIQLARITPARAGNTVYSFGSCMVSKDHPRPCGEYHQGLKERDGL